jgi:hypothetical protein
MFVPISFRVVRLQADEQSHRADLIEIRHGIPSALGAQMLTRGLSTPPSEISAEVTPEQFAQLRVGQVFDLEPSQRLGAAKGVELGVAQVAQAGGLRDYIEQRSNKY